MDAIVWGVDTIIFAILAGFGFLFLVASFLLGGVFDFFSHDVNVDVAGHEVWDISHQGEIPAAPALLNTQTILAFITGFGATGWVLSGYFGFHPLYSALVGLLGGTALLIPASFLYRTLYRQGATSSYRLEELVGQQAVVTLAIPPSGVGRVTYEFGGGSHTTLARSQDGQEVPQGSTVRIERVVGSELYVRKS